MKRKNILLLTVFLLPQCSIEYLCAEPTQPQKPSTITITDSYKNSNTLTKQLKRTEKLLKDAEKNLSDVEKSAKSKRLSALLATINKTKNNLKNISFKSGPGFELRNKSDDAIWLAVIPSDNSMDIPHYKQAQLFQINSKQDASFELKDLNQDLIIAIYQTNPGSNISESKGSLFPQPDFVYETTLGARGKTKYVTWNPIKHNKAPRFLYPQTHSFSKKTSEQYDLANNIKPFQLLYKR